MEVKNELYQYLKFPDLKEIEIREVTFYQGKFQKIIFSFKDNNGKEYDFRHNLGGLKELAFVIKEVIKFSESDGNVTQVLEQIKGRMLRPEEVDKLVEINCERKGA